MRSTTSARWRRSVASTAPASAQAAESVAANNVVDGLALYAQYDAQRNPQPPLFTRCAAVLDELGDAIDALADALVAETAHQAVRGNTARSAATLQAIAAGDRPPPELEVARTPRSGIAVTHRVLVLFADKAPAASGWPPAARSPRALAEPRLDAWAARLLGAATAVRLSVERVVADAVSTVHSLRLADLDIRPLDIVALAASTSAGATPELDALVVDAARLKFGVEAPGETLRIDPRRAADWPPGDRSLADLRELATRARQLIGNARALDARDLRSLRAAGASGIDAAEFEARASKSGNTLSAATKALASRFCQPRAPSAAALPTAACAGRHRHRQHLPAAALASRVAARAAALAPRGPAACRRAAGRSRPADRRVARAQAALQKLRTVFGNGFVAIPRFGAGNGAELKDALTSSAALQGGDALAVLPWFARAQRVREGAARLGASVQAAEAVGAGERLNLAVAQLPHVGGARWVGLPETATQPLAAGALSLVVQSTGAIDPTASMAGLLIDEWVEVVPSRSETTGIAFQHNAPDARAPQAILLAVPPGWARRGRPGTCTACCSRPSTRPSCVPSMPTRSR